jgi:hypothetical protein
LSTKEEAIILRIKHLVFSSRESDIQIGAIDALAEFGKPAVSAISEVIMCPSINSEVKKHGLRTIENIEKKGNSITPP